ncbi:hypothetical protein EVAR_41983_1 [Eumeta japonica]|uniref:Mariner Mos1 transposase n=1 Tax=Eumeta variegata TaxID=151549 RepID=A0A4C1WMK0_EUMVA|nr:hypothetical protein EVAR_41983_1 [Eumeta japonica]
MDLTRKYFKATIFYDCRSSLSPQDCDCSYQNAFGREASHLSTVRRCALEKVKEKQPRIRILLHNDNASPHTAIKMISFLTSEKVKLVNHPAFTRDLARCDFIIFPKIKDLMRGLKFSGPEKTVIAFNQHVPNRLQINGSHEQIGSYAIAEDKYLCGHSAGGGARVAISSRLFQLWFRTVLDLDSSRALDSNLDFDLGPFLDSALRLAFNFDIVNGRGFDFYVAR